MGGGENIGAGAHLEKCEIIKCNFYDPTYKKSDFYQNLKQPNTNRIV